MSYNSREQQALQLKIYISEDHLGGADCMLKIHITEDHFLSQIREESIHIYT